MRIVYPLTPRQWDVLENLAEGKPNKEIARALDLSEPTIKLHVTALFKELGVTNRTQAAVRAEKLGLFRARRTDWRMNGQEGRQNFPYLESTSRPASVIRKTRSSAAVASRAQRRAVSTRPVR